MLWVDAQGLGVDAQYSGSKSGTFGTKFRGLGMKLRALGRSSRTWDEVQGLGMKLKDGILSPSSFWRCAIEMKRASESECDLEN